MVVCSSSGIVGGPFAPPAGSILLLAAIAAGLLGACATPQRPEGSASEPVSVPPQSERAPAPPLPRVQRGGGYYLDDGPGDDPPSDLDAIPDAEPRIEPLHRYANNPYSVFGKDYVPERRLVSSKRRGIGSWYGRRFHGQKTSSGETYDMYAMTAAHPTLPIPSYARVTNPANGRSVVVRVNDRGPFHAGRIIDLSYTAAYKLGYVQNGSTLVEVESLMPGKTWRVAEGGREAPATPPARAAAEPPVPVPAGADGPDPIAQLAAAAEEGRVAELLAGARGATTWLQLAAFSSQDGAESFRARVRAVLGGQAERMHIEPGGGKYRLQLGPYSSAADAERVAKRIREAFELKPLVVRRGT
jgi:rare lipoprotein A